ncbi:hypothetical protein SZ29_08920 [Burkholderia pseudomallei]|nr:hypothetical protein SZ29_08920 [Burkholderia pseudomallei]
MRWPWHGNTCAEIPITSSTGYAVIADKQLHIMQHTVGAFACWKIPHSMRAMPIQPGSQITTP